MIATNRLSTRCLVLGILAAPFVSSLTPTEEEPTSLPPLNFEPRIVGGHNSNPGEYPFFAHWRGCGASLIYEDILLTAAHCDELQGNQVLVGAYHQGTVEGNPINSVMRTITDRRQHPGWNADNFRNDFMLLKLNKSVDLPPVRLNSDFTVPQTNSDVTAIGLGGNEAKTFFDPLNIDSGPSIPIPGVTHEGRNEKNHGDNDGDDSLLFSVRAELPLQEVEVATFAHSICNGSQMYRGNVNEPTMFCAGIAEGGRDACFGDSGGPLLLKDGGDYVQVGVISFGSGCARENRPGIYARVSAAYDWIQEQICDMSDNPPPSCNSDQQADQTPLTFQVQPVGPTPTRRPTPRPTKNPTRFPTKSPVMSPTVPVAKAEGTIVYLGSNPGSLPLALCEGDCDRDSDCKGDLICFQRDWGNNGQIPYCSGQDFTRNDFCTYADASGRTDGGAIGTHSELSRIVDDHDDDPTTQRKRRQFFRMINNP